VVIQESPFPLKTKDDTMTRHYETLTQAQIIYSETNLTSREILRQRNDLYEALENLVFPKTQTELDTAQEKAKLLLEVLGDYLSEIQA
jgi:hypothetical protein